MRFAASERRRFQRRDPGGDRRKRAGGKFDVGVVAIDDDAMKTLQIIRSRTREPNLIRHRGFGLVSRTASSRRSSLSSTSDAGT
ncbi:protein of unknown function [Burkholderia multivorans]